MQIHLGALDLLHLYDMYVLLISPTRGSICNRHLEVKNIMCSFDFVFYLCINFQGLI